MKSKRSAEELAQELADMLSRMYDVASLFDGLTHEAAKLLGRARLAGLVPSHNLEAAMQRAKEALEGTSNDQEHDALCMLAEALGISWTPPE